MVSAVIVASTDQNHIAMLPEIQDATDRLRNFMFEAVYTNPVAKAQDGRAKELLAQLVTHFVHTPEEMPALQVYRELLDEGRDAHRKMLRRIRSGAVSKSRAEAIILTGRLRGELSLAFDEIIEIMLNNI